MSGQTGGRHHGDAPALGELPRSGRSAGDCPGPALRALKDRVENRDALVEAINDILDERAVDDWIERLRDNEGPAAPIYDIRAVWEDEHVEQRKLHRVPPARNSQART